jgi:type IV secretion system protein VirB9
MKKLLFILFSVLSILPSISSAASPLLGERVITMPEDPRLVVFPYDPNISFTILARPNNITDIQLGPDEKLSAFAVGDTTLWKLQATKSADHIFVSPLRSDLFTSGTLITSKRTYQINFRSVSDRSSWYQRVSWTYPDLQLASDMSFDAGAGAADRSYPPTVDAFSTSNDSGGLDQFQSRSTHNNDSWGSSPDKLNFNYKVEGHAEFAPSQVFDDGKFTWFKITNAQEWPAIFAINADGDRDYIIDITHDQFQDTGLSGWVFERGEGWYAQFADLDPRYGFCMPSGWPSYPFEGYRAALDEVSMMTIPPSSFRSETDQAAMRPFY